MAGSDSVGGKGGGDSDVKGTGTAAKADKIEGGRIHMGHLIFDRM